MRTREDSRELARATLAAITTATGPLFQHVYKAPVRRFRGQSPVALLYSAGSDQPQTRGQGLGATLLTMTLYMACPDGQEEDVEDAFDEMTRLVVTALANVGIRLAAPTDATPGGAPLRTIDQQLYRAEQLQLHAL